MPCTKICRSDTAEQRNNLRRRCCENTPRLARKSEFSGTCAMLLWLGPTTQSKEGGNHVEGTEFDDLHSQFKYERYPAL